ncbi:MAG: hypothetical protein JKY14_02850, partial [Paraglaciecola sp.]|nr:hypothetical protein [Paraglaciecola sp.]
MKEECALEVSSTSNGLTSYELSESLKYQEISEAQFAASAFLTGLAEKSLTTNSSSFRYVIYVNGMNTTLDEAHANKAHLKKLINERNLVMNISLSYNTKEGFFTDLKQVMKQYISQPNSNEGKFKWMMALQAFSYGIASQYVPGTVIQDYIASIDYTSYREHSDMQRLRDNINIRI